MGKGLEDGNDANIDVPVILAVIVHKAL